MFNYFDQSNRLDYGSLLYPEYGYKMSFAVGCTYSLDFEALISVPVYLGAVEQPGSGNTGNPFLILESIRRSTDKIALFCNCDGIKMMRQVRPVYALLENSVFPVNIGHGNNFHPKIWVIRYQSLEGGPDVIKLIVLSRNLTFDRSMDLVVEMRGEVRGKPRRQSKQRPVFDLLNYLVSICDVKDKADQIKALARDLLRVESFELDSRFEDYDFYVTGIPGHENDSDEICAPCRKIMIVSPFLSKSVVSSMVKGCPDVVRSQGFNRVLISRISAISPDIYDLFDEVYVPIDGLQDNSLLQEADEEPKRDLHAKVIFKETYYENAIFIGSFNATSNARYNNVEIMLKLRYRPYKSSLNLLKDEFINGSYSAFKQLLAASEDNDEKDAEEMIDFTDIISSLVKAEVILAEDGSYTTIVHFSMDCADTFIMPLFIEKNKTFKKASTEVVFDHMTLSELSEFFVVKKDDNMRVIKITIDNLPIEDRDDAIIKSIINTKPKFLQYILYLLSDDPELATLEINRLLSESENNKDTDNEWLITPSIYEKMLLAAARNPEKIRAIKDIMSHVEEDKVDDDFRCLVESFDGFIGE